MARREDLEWRVSAELTTKTLLYVEDGMGVFRWSGYTLRQVNSRIYAVEFKNKELDRFTCRTDARLYAELRATIDQEELTSS